MGRPLNILLIQRILPPYRLPLFRRLATSSVFSLRVAYGRASAESALESIENPSGLSTLSLNNYCFYSGGRELVFYQRGLLKEIRRGQYDILIAEFNPRIISNVLACIYAKSAGIKFIWWGHGISPRSGKATIRIRLWLSRLADALIFYDFFQRDKFVSWGVPKDKVFVAPNSIDVEEIGRLIQDRPISERDRVLYIGRLIPQKKVNLLIQGFAGAYPYLKPETKLTIIGDGPERARLEYLVRQLDLADQVEFIGAIYEQSLLSPWFNSAWISVSPGYVGLSAIHSLAYGVPMIVARNEPHSPEIASLRDGENALFFPSDNVEALASHLKHMANDHKQWQQMAQVAKHTAQEQYGLLAMKKAFEQAVQYTQGLELDR